MKEIKNLFIDESVEEKEEHVKRFEDLTNEESEVLSDMVNELNKKAMRVHVKRILGK